MSSHFKKPSVTQPKVYTQQLIHSLVKKAVDGINSKFDKNVIEQIINASKDENGSKLLLNSFINAIDENAENDSVVFKTLKVIYICLMNESPYFRSCAQLFLPEIASIQILNFKKPTKVKYRNTIHLLSQDIYLNLVTNKPLPPPNSLNLDTFVHTTKTNKNLPQNGKEPLKTAPPESNLPIEKNESTGSYFNNSFSDDLIDWNVIEDKSPTSNQEKANFDDILFFPDTSINQPDHNSPTNSPPASNKSTSSGQSVSTHPSFALNLVDTTPPPQVYQRISDQQNPSEIFPTNYNPNSIITPFSEGMIDISSTKSPNQNGNGIDFDLLYNPLNNHFSADNLSLVNRDIQSNETKIDDSPITQNHADFDLISDLTTPPISTSQQRRPSSISEDLLGLAEDLPQMKSNTQSSQSTMEDLFQQNPPYNPPTAQNQSLPSQPQNNTTAPSQKADSKTDALITTQKPDNVITQDSSQQQNNTTAQTANGSAKIKPQESTRFDIYVIPKSQSLTTQRSLSQEFVPMANNQSSTQQETSSISVSYAQFGPPSKKPTLLTESTQPTYDSSSSLPPSTTNNYVSTNQMTLPISKVQVQVSKTNLTLNQNDNNEDIIKLVTNSIPTPSLENKSNTTQSSGPYELPNELVRVKKRNNSTHNFNITRSRSNFNETSSYSSTPTFHNGIIDKHPINILPTIIEDDEEFEPISHNNNNNNTQNSNDNFEPISDKNTTQNSNDNFEPISDKNNTQNSNDNFELISNKNDQDDGGFEPISNEPSPPTDTIQINQSNSGQNVDDGFEPISATPESINQTGINNYTSTDGFEPIQANPSQDFEPIATKNEDDDFEPIPSNEENTHTDFEQTKNDMFEPIDTSDQFEPINEEQKTQSENKSNRTIKQSVSDQFEPIPNDEDEKPKNDFDQNNNTDLFEPIDNTNDEENKDEDMFEPISHDKNNMDYLDLPSRNISMTNSDLIHLDNPIKLASSSSNRFKVKKVASTQRFSSLGTNDHMDSIIVDHDVHSNS